MKMQLSELLEEQRSAADAGAAFSAWQYPAVQASWHHMPSFASAPAMVPQRQQAPLRHACCGGWALRQQDWSPDIQVLICQGMCCPAYEHGVGDTGSACMRA